jgi:opacity protein-like surface antigen
MPFARDVTRNLTEDCMKKSLVAAALAAALVGPASAATVLDFTSRGESGIGPDNLSGTKDGIGYEITAATKLTNGTLPGTVTNSTHKTNLGCTRPDWVFACAAVGNRFDVGLGIDRPGSDNSNEVDGSIRAEEYVQVKFNSLVRILGFAGMLAYKDSPVTEGGNKNRKPGGTETVRLGYSIDGVNFTWIDALPLNDDNDPGTVGDNLFNTVGLAYLKGLTTVQARYVRFTAGGVAPFDDGNANITAAGLIVAPVPVPASLPLLLAGLGALGWAARRKRKSA